MKKLLLCGAALLLSVSAAQAFNEKMDPEPGQWVPILYATQPGHFAAVDMANLMKDDVSGDVMAFVCPEVDSHGIYPLDNTHGSACFVRPVLVRFTCDGSNLAAMIGLNTPTSNQAITVRPRTVMGLIAQKACRGY